MSSFTDGMRMGQMAWQNAMENKRAMERDQREAEEFAWRRKEYEDQQATKAAVKGELSRLDSGMTLSADRGAAQPAQGLSLGLGAPAAARGGYVGDVSSSPELTLGGGSVDRAIGVQPTPVAMDPSALGRAPTAAEREAIYGRVAQLKGDIDGMRTADTNRRAFEFKELFGKHMSEYEDDANHVNEGIKYVNKNNGVVTIGKPDKRGFSQISYVNDNGEAAFERLSKPERAQIWAASQLMESHPEEAMGIIRGVNKDLADALTKANATATSVGNANNTAAYHSGMLANDAAKTAATVAHYRAAGERAKQYMIEDDKGNRGVFTPKAFDKDGNAVLPQGYRFVLEDGQGRGKGAGLDIKVNPDGSVIKGGKLYVPDPKKPGAYSEAQGFGPTALDTALDAFTKGAGAKPKRGEAFIGAPTPGFRPMSQADMRGAASEPTVNPDTLERVSKRGLFGGVTYAYRDPATGREFSVDEYNQLLSN